MGSLLTHDMTSLLARLGTDVVALLILIGVLYRRRQSAPAMPLVFAALNIGLFASLAAITAGHFKAGVGFGLFGLLSLVRLRSTSFTLKDVAYTFVALVLGLVNGLDERQLWLVLTLNALLLLVILVADDSRSQPATRVMRLTLDHVVLNPADVAAELSARLSVPVLSAVIDDVDFIRETTRVSVRYPIDEAMWRYAPPAAEPAAVETAEA
jgi:hypothetical protein